MNANLFLTRSFLTLALFARGTSFAEPSAAESNKDNRAASIFTQFRALQEGRGKALRFIPKDRSRHIETLKDLYTRAKKLGDATELCIHINTELDVFGAAFPALRWRNNDNETVPPKAFVDPETHMIYYLECDGRHIAAITPDGKIAWYRDPFSDAGLLPYRVSKPVIYLFELATTTTATLEDSAINQKPATLRKKLAESARKKPIRTIKITFNSSQFGQIDLENGDFSWFGND